MLLRNDPQVTKHIELKLVYKNTQITDYLQTAQRMAAYFMNTLPSDGVVPWYVTASLSSQPWTRLRIFRYFRDFNAPLDPPRPADSSAAMIAANGMLLLAQQEMSLSPPDVLNGEYHTYAAIQVRLDILITFSFVLLRSPGG